MSLSDEIQKQKELLYLNAIKVANSTLEEAEDGGYEVSSGLLSASASLLKLRLNEVVNQDEKDDVFSMIVKSMVLDNDKKTKSPYYKDSSTE